MNRTDPAEDLRPHLDLMRRAQRDAPMPNRAIRAARLDRLEKALLENEAGLIAAMQTDFGHRSADECRLFDITITLGSIRRARRELRRLMRPRKVRVPLHLQPARALRQPQPKGVVGIIAPWNFPVYLSLGPMAAALAAGNRVMLKPSELTPRTTHLLSQMLHAAFEPDEIRVVTGGAEVGARFADLPLDHLFFTGSTTVGRKVAEAAGRTLVPVTLELGGKSPVIVAPDADLDRAARRIAHGKLANGGQICISPDHVLAPRALIEPLSAKIAGEMRRMLPGGVASEDYSAIISDRHVKRLTEFLDEADRAGAKVVRPLGDDGPGRKIAPALVIDPPADTQIMREEIFGPLLPILPYDDRADAARHVASGRAPLVLYLFTESGKERMFWQRQSLSGGFSVNETLVHFACETLPVGGVGASGMGAYHGDEGFESFSHFKSVFIQPRLNGTGFVTPPYNAVKRRISQVLRHFV